jgi:hypothetical protein
MMRSRPGIVGNTAFAKVPDQRRTASLSLALHRIRDTPHRVKPGDDSLGVAPPRTRGIS